MSLVLLLRLQGCQAGLKLSGQKLTFVMMESLRRNSCNSFGDSLNSLGLGRDKGELGGLGWGWRGGWVSRTFKRSRSAYRPKHPVVQVLQGNNTLVLMNLFSLFLSTRRQGKEFFFVCYYPHMLRELVSARFVLARVQKKGM